MTKATAAKETGSLFDSADAPATKPAATKATAAKAKPAAKKPEATNTNKSRAVVVHEPKHPPSGGSVVKRSEPSLMQIIAEASKNPLVDVGKMRELLAIKREIESQQAEAEFNADLLRARAEMPAIVKDRDVEGKYKYATLEKVSTEIDHIARRYGFVMSFGTVDSPLAGHYRIVCDLSHKGGLTRRHQVDLPIDDVGARGTRNKTAVQGIGSTMSYGRRYLKVLMFDLNIAGEDIDGRRRAATPEVEVETLTPEQAEKLIDLCDAEECPKEAFVKAMNDRRPKEPQAAGIAMLARDRFDEFVEAIRVYGDTKRARAASVAAKGGK